MPTPTSPLAWRLSAIPAYLILALPLWVWLVWAAFEYQAANFLIGSDFWEHSAALKTWMENLANPTNSHLASDDPSPRYMPFYFLVAALSRLLGLDPLQAMGLAGAINASLLLLAIPFFHSAYFRTAWAAPVALIVLLGGWGAGWLWSNLYQLRDLPYIIAYPSSFAFPVTLFGLYLCLRLLRAPTLRYLPLFGLFLLVAILFSSHPLTGAMGGAALALLALTEPHIANKRRLSLLSTVAAGLLAVELWPYFSTWQLVLSLPDSPTALWLAPHIELLRQHASLTLFGKIALLGGALLGALWLLQRTELPKRWRFWLYGEPSSAMPFYQAWTLLALALVAAGFYAQQPLSGAALVFALIWLGASNPANSPRRRLTFILFLGCALLALNQSIHGLSPAAWGELLQNSWLGEKLNHSEQRFHQHYNRHAFYIPQEIIVTLGPALIGLLTLFYLATQRRWAFIVSGAALMLLPYLTNLFIYVPLGHRFLLFATFFFHLALIWLLLRLLQTPAQDDASPVTWKRFSAVSFLALIALWNVALAIADFHGYHVSSKATLNVNRNQESPVLKYLQPLAERIPEDAVVMAPSLISWPLPTFSGKIVALWHGNPLVADSQQRQKSVKRFFSVRTPQKTRAKILKKYGITHILYADGKTHPIVKHELRRFAAKGLRHAGHTLIEVAQPIKAR